MFEEHSDFKPPENDNQRIWRYIDFTKFVSLIDRKELFFVCAEKLEDPFEGFLSEATMMELGEIPENSENAFIKSAQEWQRLAKERVYINSWHINDHESAAMWKLYLKSDEGLAICSTYRRLVNSFQGDTFFKEHIGLVKYLDFASQKQPLGNVLRPFLTKRKSFEYEKELRAIVYYIGDEKKQMQLRENGRLSDDGIYIPIEISILVKKIYISPKAEGWFKELVGSIANKYELNVVIDQSDLAKSPIF